MSLKFWAACCAFAAVAMASQSFEVASVKKNTTGEKPTADLKGERLFFYNVPLKFIVAIAYHVPNDRVVASGWPESEGYDIVAKVPAGTTEESVLPMIQQLLAQRFHLVIRHDTTATGVYALVLSKSAPALKPAAEGAQPGLHFSVQGGKAMCTTKSATVAELADQMTHWMPANWFDLPVVDTTGLTGHYEFTVSWPLSDIRPDTAEIDAIPLFAAIREQLGIKIERRKSPVDRIVIDRAERPQSDQ